MIDHWLFTMFVPLDEPNSQFIRACKNEYVFRPVSIHSPFLKEAQ